jgi:hypothetical protein
MEEKRREERGEERKERRGKEYCAALSVLWIAFINTRC